MSCWRRLRDWHEAGVWAALHRVLVERLQAAGQIDGAGPLWTVPLFRRKGATDTGPNPTDRGEAGSKRYICVDAKAPRSAC